MFVTREANREEVKAPPAGISGRAPRYVGLERRSRISWITSAFNEIDIGILVLSEGSEVCYANRAALTELSRDHALKIVDHRILAREARDAAKLTSALGEAASRGFRKLLVLGNRETQTTVAVVPLACPRIFGGADVMLMLGRRDFAAPLAVEAFARSRGLTLAETRVLLALCDGKAPQEIACEAKVEISTIRSQIISIRQKTGASNLRTLLAQIAALPPFTGILGQTFGLPSFAEQ